MTPFQNPLLFPVTSFHHFCRHIAKLTSATFLDEYSWPGCYSSPTESPPCRRLVIWRARPGCTQRRSFYLVLTVSFAIYTASLAQTLDFQLYDAQYYRTGADVNLYNAPVADAAGSFGITISNDPSDFLFLPMTEYEEIDGVETATRVGVYEADGHIGTSDIAGQFYGIDWNEFAETGYWRWDFSEYRLGSLLNALGNDPDGVLVPESLLRDYGVRVGDPIRITVNAIGGIDTEFQGRIVGTFAAFPTWYEEESGALFVGNLDAYYRQAGNAFPYRVWMTTDGVLDQIQLRRNLERKGLFNSSWTEPHRDIALGLERPERQGLFGLLSVGFIAATALTILGLLLYSLFSYRRRVVELGILRAVGLSTSKMTGLIAWELALLVTVGLGLGTALGVAVSRLFIPFLQTGARLTDRIPDLLVEISWASVSQVYVLYGLLFFLALISLVLIATRMKIFMAIKLGETV